MNRKHDYKFDFRKSNHEFYFSDTRATFDDYDLFIGNHKQDFYFGAGDEMNIAFGRTGKDWLIGGDKADDLLGGANSDVLVSGGGADHLDGGNGNDWLVGGGAADTLIGAAGSDYLNEGPGHGDLEGGPGYDFLVGGPGADAFVVDRNSGHDVIKDFVAGPGMFDHLALRNIKPEELRFQDTKDGVLIDWADGAGSVLLEGVFKHDLAQNDFMFTDDRYLITPATLKADRITATSFAKNEGGNHAAPNPGGATAAPNAFGFDEFNVKFGTDSSDIYQATGDRDFYFGLGGNDSLYGGTGDDHLAGDAGNDVLDGGDGQDDLRGGAGDDQLYGGAMADNLMGEDGNDYISAGAGHDMLDGGAGNDIYDGGDGADAFIVAHGSGDDIVVGGFDAGPGAFDHVAFTDILPNEVSLTDQASTHGDSHQGVLVSWGDGSLFIEGVSKTQMSQDDFMFNAVEGGGFVNDPAVSYNGTLPIFQDGVSGAGFFS